MFFATILLSAALTAAATPEMLANAPCEGAPVDATYCFRCHGNAARLSDVITDVWRYQDLLIDPKEYSRSNHAKMNCLDCHAFTWPFFPHPARTKVESLACLNCHQDQKKFGKYRFPYIEKEFLKSVHVEKLPHTFTCSSCHDPHKFDIQDPAQEIRYTVQNSNNLCRGCHLSRAVFSVLTTRKIPQLEESHSWLPNPQLHWAHVRCIECHTPHERQFSHRILSAKTAERLCEQCHTKNSILMTTLYRYRTSESRLKLGFANSVVLNDAYIIGMTRNTVLDWVFALLFGGVLLGIGGHAALRIFFARGRRHDQ